MGLSSADGHLVMTRSAKWPPCRQSRLYGIGVSGVKKFFGRIAKR